VYLRKLRICNFRKLKSVEIALEPGLNILVGPNNVGKTTVIDALRALLNNQDEPSPRLSEEDTYRAALTGHTFVERQYDAQLNLPLASNF
jgi:putative ATP-dependent endonuclease of OLD family